MPNELNEYQKFARSTAIYDEKNGLIYTVLGLNGEAGECAEKLKKQMRDNSSDFKDEHFKDAMKKELGDSLWYLSNVAYELGFTLKDVAEANKEKLQSRKTRGKIHGSGDER